jgi:hypothetical protein
MLNYEGKEAFRTALELEKGRVWSGAELQEEFEVIGFVCGYVVVKHKVTGKRGSMLFESYPRLYHSLENVANEAGA